MVDNRIAKGLEDPAQLLQVIDRIVMLFQQVFRLRRKKAVVEQIVGDLSYVHRNLSFSFACVSRTAGIGTHRRRPIPPVRRSHNCGRGIVSMCEVR